MSRAVVLVVDDGSDFGERLRPDIDRLGGGTVTATTVPLGDLSTTVVALEHGGDVAPLVLLADPSSSATVAAAAPTCRRVWVTDSVALRDLEPALGSSSVDALLARPWTDEGLGRLLRAHLATHLVAHHEARLAEFVGFLDHGDVAAARRRLELRSTAVALEGPVPAHPLLDTSSEDEELEEQLVTALDEALGHPPRLLVAPGTVLVERDEDVGGIFVILEGRVWLTSSTESGEQVLHENSTGRIVGLLSLATRRRAMLQSSAATDVRAIPVTLDQLARALQVEPALSGLLNRVLIGSLARRLRRSDELQIQLDHSLAALSEARAELVSQARSAALGELSAGVAHELNNPAAALVRALDHLGDDLSSATLDDRLVSGVRRGLDAPARSSAERRALRRTLQEAVGDRALAERLVDLGLDDPAEARRLAALPPDELDRVETAIRLGTSLRNATSAASRISGLVGSLRAYLHGDDGAGPMVPGVDVGRTIHSALRLAAHRAEGVEVETRLAEVPTVRARPGALQSVWSNLVSNAFDALAADGAADGGPPRVLIECDTPDPATVEVRVTDNGPGIPGDIVEQVFEPRFTTKGGRVQFGLGLGLSISRQIVRAHDGAIAVVSEPGRTVFTVRLPAEPVRLPAEGAS